MLFSIISICYNNLEGLKKTLKSIEKQTNKEYEVIVVDGNSTDGTQAYLKQNHNNIKWISENDTGVYNAMNKGIDLATNDYIIFMNAGDIFYCADVLEEVASVLHEHKDIEFLYGDACIAQSDGQEILNEYHAPLMEGKNICHQSIFYHRNLFQKYGKYDEGYKIVGDYDLNLRLLKKYQIQPYHIRLPICYFEYGGLSTSPKWKKIRDMDCLRLGAEWDNVNITISDIKKVKIVRSNTLLDLKKYQENNNQYMKKIAYRLGDSAGLFSEINNMIFAMVFAYDSGIKFCLSSENSNIGEKGWNQYFIPFTEEINSPELNKFNYRYIIKDKQKSCREFKLKTDINFLTQDIFHLFFENDTFISQIFNFPNLHIFGNSFAVASKIAQAIYHLNDKTISQIDNLKRKIKLPKDYIAVQVRRGDIVLECSWRNQDIISINKYIEVISQQKSKNLFIFTDDYSVIEDFRKKLPDYNIYTLCNDNEQGFKYKEFEKLSEEMKINSIIKILANIEICRESQHFIGTRVSNPSTFLALIMKPEKFTFIDCDHLMWQKQYNALINKSCIISNVNKSPITPNDICYKISLFKVVPLLTKIKKSNSVRYKILGCTVWKTKWKADKSVKRHYLFNIPILKINKGE